MFEFGAERDRFFTVFITKVMVNMTLVFIFPFIFDPSTRTLYFIAVWTTIYLVLLFSVIFSIMRIKYEFHDSYLLVKGGPIKSKIPYDKITSVSMTPDIYCGYRVLTSSEAIEIFYEGGRRSSVKISPKEQDRFLEILSSSCPQAKVSMM